MDFILSMSQAICMPLSLQDFPLWNNDCAANFFNHARSSDDDSDGGIRESTKKFMGLIRIMKKYTEYLSHDVAHHHGNT